MSRLHWAPKMRSMAQWRARWMLRLAAIGASAAKSCVLFSIMNNRYSPQPPPRSYSNLNVDCLDGIIRPQPQRSPLTKQVNQLAYEIPKNKYAQNPWNYAPEFLKVFGDVRVHVGGKAVFDCVLLGSPRPKVCWLFNDDKMKFTDVTIEDTADICRLTIPYVQPYHFGEFTVLCENEVGRAVASAQLLPL